jgi:hypothetical protein
VTEELHGELRTLRDKLSELTAKRPQNKEHLKSVLFGVSKICNLSDEVIDAMTEFLYPVFSGIDIKGKTLVINVPMAGQIPEDTIFRYYAYADTLKGIGAASVIFLPEGAVLTQLSDDELEKKGLRRT